MNSKIKEYCDAVWSLGDQNTYYPKLSVSVLKSCKGCAMLQKLITVDGFERKDGGQHYGAQNFTMFDGDACDLGYKVWFQKDTCMPHPRERCLKPKTRRQLTICGNVKMKFGEYL